MFLTFKAPLLTHCQSPRHLVARVGQTLVPLGAQDVLGGDLLAAAGSHVGV